MRGSTILSTLTVVIYASLAEAAPIPIQHKRELMSDSLIRRAIFGVEGGLCFEAQPDSLRTGCNAGRESLYVSGLG